MQRFSVDDVVAITDAGFSTKNNAGRLANSFIGEKGIGFKSVFALASLVEIESPPWHFTLDKDECVIPKAVNRSYPREELREYILYEEDGEFPEALVLQRWEKLDSNVGSLKRRMAVAAAADTTGSKLPVGRLYCFLPTEIRLPLPVFLQVDGHTKADRERLQNPESNNWNRHLFKLLPGFLSYILYLGIRPPPLSVSVGGVF